jgi:hypothetical protein
MTMTSTIRLGAVTLGTIGLLFMLFMPTAHTQTKPSAGPSVISPPDQATTPANIPEDKLDAVAGAVKNVSAIMDTYEQKVARAPAADKQRLIDEADDAVTKAVTNHGLSVEEYTSIIRVAEKDPVVRDKLLKRLD